MKIIDKIFRFFFGEVDMPSPKENSVKSAVDTEEFARCVLCGAKTDVPITMPIDLRENYVVGFGQVCSSCARNLLRDENAPSPKQIIRAVEKSKLDVEEK